jgi:hypothetical protein
MNVSTNVMGLVPGFSYNYPLDGSEECFYNYGGLEVLRFSYNYPLSMSAKNVLQIWWARSLDIPLFILSLWQQ